MPRKDDLASRSSKGSGLWRTVAMVSLILLPGSCAGPQPLYRAIDPRDQDEYVRFLNASSGDGRAAFVNWMAKERHASPEAIVRADSAVSTTRNPFDAHGDPKAVSRGAVLYKLHCARCHGEDARGRGPSTLSEYPATDFKTFGKRLAATLHRGAPRKWFRVIRDGSGDIVQYPDEKTTAMPAFGDKLAREQAWLVITYLQSLDIHAVRDAQERRQ